MWLELEDALFNEFVSRRALNLPVRRSWFRKRSISLYKELYLEALELFCFSIGWLSGFLKRASITLRAITHQVCSTKF